MAQTLLKEPVVSARKLHLATKQPFPVSQMIPNAETVRAIEETRSSKNRFRFDSVAEMNLFLDLVVQEDE